MTEFRPGRFQILPVIIKNLIIINALVFLAQLTFDGIMAGGDLSVKTGKFADLFALHHLQSPLFKPWQLITHIFMHGSLMHIFSNMFALWMFGSILENLWGPKRFITFYLICGLGAALLHLGFLWYESLPILRDFNALEAAPSFQNFLRFYNEHQLGSGPYGRLTYNAGAAWEAEPGNSALAFEAMEAARNQVYYSISEPTLGASGAVFGCLAAFAYLFPNTYIYLYFFVPIKAKWLILGYLAFELIMAFRNSAGDDIARWAHLGGALVGFLLVLLGNKRNKKHFY